MGVLAAQQIAQHISFGVMAFVAVVGGIGVVTTRNVVHAALYLVLVLASVGAVFLLLGAEFTGITQILVYIGAIVVLFLFGVMLTRAPIGRSQELTGRGWGVGLFVSLALAGLLGYALLDQWGNDKLPAESRQYTAQVGDSIFRDYLVPFEVSSVLLLAALVGAIVLARRD